MPDTDTTKSTMPDDTGEYGTQAPIIPDDVIDDSSTDNDHNTAVSVPNQSVNISDDDLPIINDIISKIDDANNILIALSSDPSVDELAAAIGLSLILDRLGKRVTAIYSGVTPDALSFLNPEKTFEPKPDALQDFVIALNKDKADHLRYKIDGDYVKIFITPYRSRISQDDLEFSYGDFNVDLVIALKVANGVDLDSALREHGRIMHDATIVNITTAKPGKLGEIEWSDLKASSVSEMVTELVSSTGKLEKEEATALLTGIVAATDRFANSHTTSHSLEVASYLINFGANQQVIAKNVASNIDGDSTSSLRTPKKIMSLAREEAQQSRSLSDDREKEDDATSLEIHHHDDSESEEAIDAHDVSNLEELSKSYNTTGAESEDDTNDDDSDDGSDNSEATEPSEPESLDDKVGPFDSEEDSDDSSSSDESDESEEKDKELTEDLEETEATLSTAGAEVVPDKEKKPFSLEVNTKSAKSESDTKSETPSSEPSPEGNEDGLDDNDKDGDGIVGPFGPQDEEKADNPETSAGDFISNKAEKVIAPPSDVGNSLNNPATSFAPSVATTPEVNNVPDMNYMPMPGDEILPPPPTPPVDFGPSAPSDMSSFSQPAPAAMPTDSMSPLSSPNPFLNNSASTGMPSMSAMPSPMSPMPSMSTMPGVNPTPNANTFMNQPATPEQLPNQPINNPSSFQIPGM